MTKIQVTEAAVRYFRARRGLLVAGAETPADAANTMVGIQAQQEGPALMGLSLRCADHPNSETLKDILNNPGSPLVRTWGQRDTLHILDANSHWRDMVAARDDFTLTRRTEGIAPDDLVDRVFEFIRTFKTPFPRVAIYDQIGDAFVEAITDYATLIKQEPQRFGAGRVLWSLANRGQVCQAGRDGAEGLWIAREHWRPDLSWPSEVDTLAAAQRLTSRYLKTYGPATPADVAHFFGTKVTIAKHWLAGLDTTDIDCGGRKGLLLLTEDEAAIREPIGPWPVRMLPLWDGLLMAHKDKTWTLPVEADRKKVYRPGAYVAATVIDQGCLVAVWKYKALTRALKVEVSALSGWHQGLKNGIEAEAERIATHLGLTEVRLTLPR